MKHRKRLVLSLPLMCVLAGATFAQAPSCVKGIMETPPCALASPSDDEVTDPGQTNTPPASDTVEVVDIVKLALWALTLF